VIIVDELEKGITTAQVIEVIAYFPLNTGDSVVSRRIVKHIV
jgi:hypothetical protein